jgi:alpha-L-fucosidase
LVPKDVLFYCVQILLMRKLLLPFFCLLLTAPIVAQNYSPTAENQAARTQFQNNKYGLFIHWGLFSMLADGEWVMNNRNIRIQDYKKLVHAFDPSEFDAAQWVSTAKNAGMNYIVFITRHHDGFSNWDTKFSDYKITNTPYKKDVLRQLADECKKQGMQLGLYYSLLDWSREDYPRETGRTGQFAGRTQKSDYASYLQFMKNQLTELLTNYGDIMSIWFDGHWDQTNAEGETNLPSRVNWHYDEIYSLIHQLQPKCLIGNNHHITPFEGEDFQMFERDLPGDNKSGLSFQKTSTQMPVETCETINGAWGYHITDRNFKTSREIIQLLVGAAGRNANLLLNVGPMPTGPIQPEFVDSLASAGKWLQSYGESVYGTRGGPLPPQPWGVTTVKNKRLFVHLFKMPVGNIVFIPGYMQKIASAKLMGTNKAVRFSSTKDGLMIYADGIILNTADTIIELTLL